MELQRVPAHPPQADLPPADTLPRLLRTLTGRMSQGERFTLKITRAEKLDAGFKNRMYVGEIDMGSGDPKNRLRWLGRGLDAAGKPFVAKNGHSYIRMAPDKRLVGMPPPVEIADPKGDTQYLQVGFFLLFQRPDGYGAQFYTGVDERPLITLFGFKSFKDGVAFITCDLSLATSDAKLVNPKPRAPAEPAAPRLEVVSSDAGPARFNW